MRLGKRIETKTTIMRIRDRKQVSYDSTSIWTAQPQRSTSAWFITIHIQHLIYIEKQIWLEFINRAKIDHGLAATTLADENHPPINCGEAKARAFAANFLSHLVFSHTVVRPCAKSPIRAEELITCNFLSSIRGVPMIYVQNCLRRKWCRNSR